MQKPTTNSEGQKMKKIFILAVMALVLSGCVGSYDSNTRYETIDHKDVSLKIRSVMVDLDYDSRVAVNPGELNSMEPLPDLKEGGIKPLEPIE